MCDLITVETVYRLNNLFPRMFVSLHSFPWNVLLVFLSVGFSLSVDETRWERTDVQIKGTYRHRNLLWSLECVNWLFSFALIRRSRGAHLKSVAAASTRSLLTYLEAMCSFKFFSFSSDTFQSHGSWWCSPEWICDRAGSQHNWRFQGGQWAGEDLRISFVLPGRA